MLEWFFLAAILFFTGWLLQAYAFAPLAPTQSPVAVPVLAQSHDIRAYKPESWCLVGENTLGRYCVPSENCGPLERFPSQEACEYVEASALPLGITGEGGLHYNPFLSKETRYHTF
jgi:hypothetical protein